MTSTRLRERAEMCIRLAGGIADREIVTRLRTLAVELEAQARTTERANASAAAD